MIDPVIQLSARLALALLFGAAAWHKLADRRRFEATVRRYELGPAWAVPWVSRLLPPCEIALSVGLLFGATRHAAAAGSVALLAVYAAAVGINLRRGRRDLDCGCFAWSARTPVGPWLLRRNLGLAALACLVLLPSRPRSLIWVDWATIATTLVASVLLFVAVDRLANTGPAWRELGGRR